MTTLLQKCWPSGRLRRERTDLRCRAVSLLISLLIAAAVDAQITKEKDAPSDVIGQHYELAQKAQAAGDLVQASAEYRAFVSEALRRLASRYAAGGDLEKSVALLEQALDLTPNDSALRLDYAKACRELHDLAKAKAAAENVLMLEPNDPGAHLELGRILSQMGKGQEATAHMERAVALNPNFENGYELAKEYLKRKEPDQASKIFAEMQAGLGDSAGIHMEFGRAYAEAGYPERGIPEFEKAIEMNGKIPGGHYSLGAAYLLGLGNAAEDKAAAEFEKELTTYPEDPLSLYQLGSIEYRRHLFPAAEQHLTKAQNLDPRNPDVYLVLGQIYIDTNRTKEAENSFRKCIALTSDVRRNNYQVQQAHYLLARLLMQAGQKDEAKKEMGTAEQLLKQSMAATQGVERAAGSTISPSAIKTATPASAEALREANSFETRIRDAVADGYNNLGAIAATKRNFPSALADFWHAAEWNPSLEGLDYNWGRAAFSAGNYQQAIEPLARHLAKHPDDSWVRAALGSSYFSLQQYAEALQALRPMEAQLGASAQLGYIYAVSQIKTGEKDAGVKRLEALEKDNPEVALIPKALAEEYRRSGRFDEAARQEQLAESIQIKQPKSSQPQDRN